MMPNELCESCGRQLTATNTVDGAGVCKDCFYEATSEIINKGVQTPVCPQCGKILTVTSGKLDTCPHCKGGLLCRDCQKPLIEADLTYGQCYGCWLKRVDPSQMAAGRRSADTSGVQSTVSTTYYGKFCGGHAPNMLITHPKYDIFAASKPKVEAKNFDLLLNCSECSLSKWGDPKFPKQYAHLAKHYNHAHCESKEILLDWGDYQGSPVRFQFWVELEKTLAKAKRKKKVCIFCLGGHGRTGTAMACMLMVACDWDADTAIEYLMAHYCEQVIDTNEQELYVRHFENYLKRKLKRKLHTIKFIQDDKPQVEQQNIMPSDAWCQACKLADIDCICEVPSPANLIPCEKETDQDEILASTIQDELESINTTQWYIGANGSTKGVLFSWDFPQMPAEKDIIAGPFNSEEEALIWQQGFHQGGV